MKSKPKSKTANQPSDTFRLKANSVEEKNGRFLATLCAEGHIRNRLGKQSAKYMTAAALQAAYEEGKFNGIVCILDHPEWFSDPEVKNICGHWVNPEWDDVKKELRAELELLSIDGELTDTAKIAKAVIQMYLSADDDAKPDVGVSIAFYPDWEWENEVCYCTAIRRVESGDLVIMPAVNSARFIESLSAFNLPVTFNQMEVEPMNKDEPQADEDATTLAADQPEPTPADPTAAEPTSLAAGSDENDAADAWIEQFASQAITATLRNSGLPQPSIDRLSAQSYGHPDQLNKAIADERAYLGKLNEHNVVQLHGSAPVTSNNMRTPLDQAREIVEWAFAAHDDDTFLPPPEMRNFKTFYELFTGDYEGRGIFDSERSRFTGASTTDLPNLALDALNKRIISLLTFVDAYRWWENAFAVVPNDGSWKPVKLIPYGGVGNLPVVAEQAAYGALTPTDGKEDAIFSKNGAYIPLTLEMMRGSELAKMQAIPQILLEAAYRTRSASCASILTANSGVGPNMADGNPVFHASGGNVGALGLDQTNFETVSNAVYRQALPGSAALNAARPEMVFVHSNAYFSSLALFGYGKGETTTINPLFEGRGITDPRPKPIVVPEFTDTNDWAVSCNPMLRKTLCVSYGNGASTHQRPELFTMAGETSHSMFHNDQILIKIRDLFAVGISSRVGIYKNNVA